jgi:hypothetical protein
VSQQVLAKALYIRDGVESVRQPHFLCQQGLSVREGEAQDDSTKGAPPVTACFYSWFLPFAENDAEPLR